MAAIAWSNAAGDDSKRVEGDLTPASTVSARPLRESGKRSTSTALAPAGGAAAWVDPVRCDQDGGLYFVVLPQVSPRDANRPPGSPGARPWSPREIVRVGDNGRTATRFDPGSVPAFAGADEVKTLATAIDSQGVLSALVWVPRGEAEGRQYIVSFDKSGRYTSRVEVDHQEIVVQQFEVFGSGELLLKGFRHDEPRLAVMSGAGDLRDVLSPAREAPVEPRGAGSPGPSRETAPNARLDFDHMVRGGDGRIYVARGGESSVYAIEPSAEIEEAFRLSPPPGSLRLAGLRASGRRLVATYYEQQANRMRSWMAVYDVALKEQLALYGPADGPPLCYEYSGSEDRFTYLRNGNQLATLSPE
jgi:hypothetical protein